MMKWFKNCKTQKEAKSLYHTLCRKYHPDLGGDVATMQEINSEFEKVFERLPKDSNSSNNTKSADSKQTATGNEQTAQTAKKFMKIIQELVKCEGLTIEIVGSWIWLSGDVYKYLRKVKQMGFMYSTKHKKYYLNDGESMKRRSKYSFEQICDKYGVETMQSQTVNKLVG